MPPSEKNPVSVALPILKILPKNSDEWQWITDIRGVVDQGYRDDEYITEFLKIPVNGGGDGPAKVLFICRLDGEAHYAFRAKKIYLCNGTTGSTIDRLLA